MKKRLDNLFASKFILKFPTPPVQEKEDFPQRQQWTVSDSTLLGKEKLIITVSSFLLLNTSTAVIFGWVSADSLLSNHIPGKQRFKPIEQGCGLYILQCQCRNVLDCIPLLHQHKRKKKNNKNWNKNNKLFVFTTQTNITAWGDSDSMSNFIKLYRQKINLEKWS